MGQGRNTAQLEQLADLVQSFLHYGVCDSSMFIKGEQGV
jgi:hypothetical protein